MIGPLLDERHSYAPRTRVPVVKKFISLTALFTYRSVPDFAFVLIKPAEWQARAQAGASGGLYNELYWVDTE